MDMLYNGNTLAYMSMEKVEHFMKTAHQLVEDTRVADLRYQIVGAYLMKLASEGNIEPYIKHMNNFRLNVVDDEKLGCGIWCFDPGGTRFYERKDHVHPERSLEDQLDMAKDMTGRFGLAILQAHYSSADSPISAEVDEETIALYKQCEAEGGPALKHLAGFTFKPKQYEFGGHTNPIKEIREMARDNTIGMLRMCKEHDLHGGIIWPGGDGYRNGFGVPFPVVMDYFAAVVAEAMDEVPGVPVLIEPKPYEPAMNNHLPTTMEAVLFAQNVESRLRDPTNRVLLAMGIPLVQLQPEVGHGMMAYERIERVWSLSAGRLLVSHENDNPEGNFDQDRCPGTINRNVLDKRLYALKQMGFRGDFVLDIMPEVTPIEDAVECAVEEYYGSEERIERVDHELVIMSHLEPGKYRGMLEKELARTANPNPRPLW